MVGLGRKARATGTGPGPEENLEELRAQAAVAMARARRMASDDPLERALVVAELRAEDAALLASGARKPFREGWYRGPGDPDHVERYWDGAQWTEDTRDLSGPVVPPDVLPFTGDIVWLTSAQGGRPSGPPAAGTDYLALACVPPTLAQLGAVPFVLRGFFGGAARSPATGGWLTVDGAGPGVRIGSLLIIVEDTLPVGYFTVSSVLRPAE
jgi:hypothetical protein